MASTTSATPMRVDDEARKSTPTPSSHKRRRRRGRRAPRKSSNGQVHDDSPVSEWDTSSVQEERSQPSKRRRRTNSLNAPQAPRNTNEFLLQDIEVRDHEADVAAHSDVGRVAIRARSSSNSFKASPSRQTMGGSEDVDDGTSSCGGGEVVDALEEEQRMMEEEFEEDVREVAMEEYADTGRDELIRKMVDKQEQLRQALERAEWLRKEMEREQERNERLTQENIQLRDEVRRLNEASNASRRMMASSSPHTSPSYRTPPHKTPPIASPRA